MVVRGRRAFRRILRSAVSVSRAARSAERASMASVPEEGPSPPAPRWAGALASADAADVQRLVRIHAGREGVAQGRDGPGGLDGPRMVDEELRTGEAERRLDARALPHVQGARRFREP